MFIENHIIISFLAAIVGCWIFGMTIELVKWCYFDDKIEIVKVGGLRISICDIVAYTPIGEKEIQLHLTDDVVMECAVDIHKRDQILEDLDKKFKMDK